MRGRGRRGCARAARVLTERLKEEEDGGDTEEKGTEGARKGRRARSRQFAENLKNATPLDRREMK